VARNSRRNVIMLEALVGRGQSEERKEED
jgi:hypothetical protein